MDNQNNTQDEDPQVKFRKQVCDHVYASDKKPFLTTLPPNSSKVALFFALLFMGVIAVLFLVKLPIVIPGSGEITTGSRYVQINATQGDQVLKKWYVKNGDKVSLGQPLALLITREQGRLLEDQASYLEQISLLEMRIEKLDLNVNQTDTMYQQRVAAQNDLIASVRSRFVRAEEVTKVYSDSVSAGLLSNHTLYQQQDARAATDAMLKKEIATLSDLRLSRQMLNYESGLLRESLQVEIARLKQQKRSHDGNEIITSPCECEVTIIRQEGEPLAIGNAVITLKSPVDSAYLHLYFRSDKYRPLLSDEKIAVSLSAYPSMKYGMLKTTVKRTGSSPLPGSVLDKAYLAPELSYFLVESNAIDIPKEVELTSGMRVAGDVVVGHQSLISMLFD